MLQHGRALIQIPLSPLGLARLLKGRGVCHAPLLVQLCLQLAASRFAVVEAGLGGFLINIQKRRKDEVAHTWAAAAARARASSPPLPPGVVGDDDEAGDEGDVPPPRVRGGPPTFRGDLAVAEAGTETEARAGGVVPRGRPGCEKGSRSLLQRLPIFYSI